MTRRRARQWKCTKREREKEIKWIYALPPDFLLEIFCAAAGGRVKGAAPNGSGSSKTIFWTCGRVVVVVVVAAGGTGTGTVGGGGTGFSGGDFRDLSPK